MSEKRKVHVWTRTQKEYDPKMNLPIPPCPGEYPTYCLEDGSIVYMLVNQNTEILTKNSKKQESGNMLVWQSIAKK